MRVLRRGSKGPDVVELKRLLASQGMWPATQLGVRFGPKTKGAVEYFQSTHLGPQGRPLGVDGRVGPSTWWALRNPTGTPQRSGLASNKVPAGIGEGRAAILRVALAQHGIKERPNGSNRGTTPKGGVDKFTPAWSRPGPKGPAWCCFFVFWCVKDALGRYVLSRRHGSCHKASKEAKVKKVWIPNKPGTIPVPGMGAMILRPGGTGHAFLIYRVSRDGLVVNTAEGNCGNRVKVGKRRLDDGTITGFIDFCPHEPTTGFQRGLVAAASSAGDGTR